MSHPEFLGLGVCAKYLSKKRSENIFFDRFFDAIMQDFTWLET